MLRLIHFITILFFFTIPAFTQDTIDFAKADVKTYTYYQSAQWDSVIHYGKMALKNDIDYFYLRARLGTAYYNKFNYSAAIREFEKALTFNSGDAYAQEMLYWSYVNAGRGNDAIVFADQMDDVAKERAEIRKTKFLSSLYFEAGPVFSNNISANKNNVLTSETNTSGSAYLYGNISYGHLGFTLTPGKKISFYLGFNFIGEEQSTLFEGIARRPSGKTFYQWDTIVNKPLPPPGHITYDTIFENRWMFKDTLMRTISEKPLKQKEFYLNCNLHLGKGLELTPFIHIVNARYTYLYASVKKNIFYDTISTHTQFYFPEPPGGMTDTVFYEYIPHENVVNYIVKEGKGKLTNFSAGLTLTKNLGPLLFSMSGSFSNLNGLRQKEAILSSTFYPFGNQNLYLLASMMLGKNGKDNISQYGFLAGTKITDMLWIEAATAFGEMVNYTEKNGFVVDNCPDVTKFRCSLMPVLYFKKFSVNLQYAFQSKEGSVIPNKEGIDPGSFTYQNHMIIGGVKWNF